MTMTEKTETRTTINDKTVTEIEKVSNTAASNWHLNFYDQNKTLLETATYSSEAAADAYASEFGALSFDKDGWWRSKTK